MGTKRTRNQQNRDVRNTSVPEPVAGNGELRLLDDVNMPTLDGTVDGYSVVYDSGTDRFILVNVLSAVGNKIAHGRTDNTSNFIATGDGVEKRVEWPVSLITDVSVCPLTMFGTSHEIFTTPEAGYYHIGFNLRIRTDPKLFDSTLEFRLYIDGTLIKSFPVDGADWEVNYSGVFQMLLGDPVELRFIRTGAGYADPVDLRNSANFIFYKLGYIPDLTGLQAFNEHTDTNFGTPGAGQDGYVVKWNNGTSRYVLAAASLVAHTLSQHTDASWTLGAGVDGYVVTYNHAGGNFQLTTKAAGALALDDLTDVVITAPASGHVLSYNGTNWVNSAAAPPGPHALDDHTDVAVPTPVNGDLLSFNGTNWVNVTRAAVLAGHNHSFDSLSDVNMAGKSNGSIPRWNVAANKYIPATLSLDDLSDVVSTAPAEGNALVYSGGIWGPGTVAAAAAAGEFVFVSNGVTQAAVNASFSTPGGIYTFTAGTTGKWLIAAFTDAGSGTQITVGGAAWAVATPWGAVAGAHRGAGSTFEVRPGAGGSLIGTNHNIIMWKIGS